MENKFEMVQAAEQVIRMKAKPGQTPKSYKIK